MKKEDTLLYKFLDYYFSREEEWIESSRVLAEKFDCSRAKIKTIIDHMHITNYIYNSSQNIFYKNMAKWSFTSDFKIEVQDPYVNFDAHGYNIKFLKFELDKVMEEYELESYDDIKEIRTLIFIAYVFYFDYKTTKKGIAYIKDDIVWYKRKFFYKYSDIPLFESEYTQFQDYITFGAV